MTVAGPHGGGGAAVQVDTHADLGLLIHALAVFFAVAGMVAALRPHMNIIVERHVDLAVVQVVYAGITDRHQNVAQVRVAGEERRLTNGEWAMA